MGDGRTRGSAVLGIRGRLGWQPWGGLRRLRWGARAGWGRGAHHGREVRGDQRSRARTLRYRGTAGGAGGGAGRTGEGRKEAAEMPGQGGWPPGVSGGLTRSSREGAEGRARGPGTGRGAGGAGAQQDLSVQVQERQQEDRGGWTAASVSVPPPALTPARPSTQRARRRRRDRARRMGGWSGEMGVGSGETRDPRVQDFFLAASSNFLRNLAESFL
jgi:hypothetical protein